MATVTCTLDTDANTMTVNVDGETIENPSYFSAYMGLDYYSGDPEVSFNVSKTERVDGVSRTVSICGSDMETAKVSEKTKSLIASKSKPSAEAGIQDFFGSRNS